MFRHRHSVRARRARHRAGWLTGLAALVGCGAAALAVHVVTAPSTVRAVSSAEVTRVWADRPYGGQATHHGYGRGGYPMMLQAAEATAMSSENWSGYVTAATPGTFTSVSTSWTQPSVTCGAADTFSSFWAGLDGDGTPTVEQTGSEADCSDGTAVYAGWYEIFPDAPVFYDEPVQPGDAMSASVVGAAGGSFTLTLHDATQGWTRTTNQTVPGAELGSAEVIAEAPSGQAVLPLADFATVNFANATVDGQPIGADYPVPLTLVSADGTAEATPSALTGSSSFTVTFDGTAASPSPAAPGPQGTGHHHHHGGHGQG